MKTKIISVTTTILLIFGTQIQAAEVQMIRDASGRKIGTITIMLSGGFFAVTDGGADGASLFGGGGRIDSP